MARIDQEMHVAAPLDEDDDGIDFIALFTPAARHWKAILATAILAGAVGVGASYLVAPKFTASNVFLPPQQPQSSGASALASLGALSGLSLGGGSTKNSPDEYIALMQSATVSDRIIKKFDLKARWEDRFQIDARKHLLNQVNISAGKKDGLMHVDVTDTDPVRAAAIANQYVEELRTLTNGLAVTEAQQRRMFFEHLLEETRDKLGAAQVALEAGGYTAGALNAEPRSAAEGYARIQAELTSARVKLQVLRRTLADGSPEAQSQQELVNALTSQLAKLESQDHGQAHSSDYINRYREFKYQETLFDLFARQYENARVDESREGALIQVLDKATPPERKSAPGRLRYGEVSALLAFLIAVTFFVIRGRKESGNA